MAIVWNFIKIWIGIAAFFLYFAAWMYGAAWLFGAPDYAALGLVGSVAIPSTLILAVVHTDED